MNILITGGTGSVGRVLAEILTLKPEVKKIIVYSRDEHKQEKMFRHIEADERLNPSKMRYFIGDIRDRERLKTAMRGVTHVIHTAALKIVPAMEYNPMEAVKTNIQGTQNVLDCAGECGVSRVISLSTDKAVHPVNLYGATKLCAEKLTVSANNVYPNTDFDVVRYGNVAMSHGSVIPLFFKWQEHKLPLQITSMDMTRFWITLYDAANFVVNKLLHHYNGARGLIFVPDMDAYHMEDLVSIFSDPAIKNKIIGIRPGEKIHEQIITDFEVSRAVRIHPEGSKSYTVVHPEWDNFTSPDIKEAIRATHSNTTRRIPKDELVQKIGEIL